MAVSRAQQFIDDRKDAKIGSRGCCLQGYWKFELSAFVHQSCGKTPRGLGTYAARGDVLDLRAINTRRHAGRAGGGDGRESSNDEGRELHVGGWLVEVVFCF